MVPEHHSELEALSPERQKDVGAQSLLAFDFH